MTSCHLIPTWHEWNANAGDVMVTWFASYANLVMSHWACTLCVHMHGTCATIRNSVSKYPSVTEFRQPLQVQSHLEMPRILVQLGHTQCT